MKINIDDINTRNDPYQLFLDNIKNAETSRKYKKSLYRFLQSIPNEVYQNNIEKIPKDDERILSACFVDLARENVELVTDIIATFIKQEKNLVESGNLKPGTLANHIKPIKVLLDANRIAIH